MNKCCNWFWGKAFLILISVFYLTGCSSNLSNSTPTSESIQINSNTIIRQAILARYDGFSEINIELVSENLTPSDFIIRFGESTAQGDILLTELTGDSISNLLNGNGIPIPNQKSSTNKIYYIELTSKKPGQIHFSTYPAQSSPDHTLLVNDEPQDFLINSLPGYSFSEKSMGVLSELLNWGYYFVIIIWLFFLPGLAAIIASKVLNDTNVTSNIPGLIASFGIGFSIYPVLFLFTELLSIDNSSFLPVLVPLLAIVILFFNRKDLQELIRNSSIAKPSSIFTIVLSLSLFFSRLWSIRNLAGPMWGDSVHHSFIAQLIFENNGLFESWMPYAPFKTFSIHYGFPLLTAMFMKFSGTDSIQATLVFGQFLNAIAIVSMIPLASKIVKSNEWLASGIIIIGGFLLPLPNMYTNWGRYAQLLGIAIMLSATWFVFSLLGNLNKQSEGNSNKSETFQAVLKYLLAAIFIAGMTLSYYRAPIFFGFLLLILVPTVFVRSTTMRKRWLHALVQLSVIAALAILILSPWFWDVFQGNLGATVSSGINTGASADYIKSDLLIWTQYRRYYPPYILFLSAVSLLFALEKKKSTLWVLGAWGLLMVGYFVSGYLKIPGASVLSNFAIMISMFVPVSIITGWFLSESFLILVSQFRQTPKMFVFVFSSLISLGLGFYSTQFIEPYKYALLTFHDIQAFDWINKNTPKESMFLIQGFSINNGTSIVGADGGWWLPLTTKRLNSIPPQYALLNEQPNSIDGKNELIALTSGIEASDGIMEAHRDHMCNLGITHIYNGQRGGKIGSQAAQLFSPNDPNLEDLGFTIRYLNDKVRVYQLDLDYCSTK